MTVKTIYRLPALTSQSEVQGGMNWKIGFDNPIYIGIYTLLILYMKQVTNENPTQCSVVT